MSLKSRLHQQLDKAIAAAPSHMQAAGWRTQRAVLLARHGQLEAAREELTALHQLAFQHPHPQLGAWLHLAEGLMSYFTDFSGGAYEKLSRARAIAHMAGLREIEALAAAWLAHLAYVRHDIEALIEQASTCRTLAAPDQHAARSRLAMALGLAHHFAGKPELAQAWYTKSRQHAMAEGDDATQSALMYNSAEMRTAEVRREALSDPTRPIPELLLSADSIARYDAAVGGSAMGELMPILRAQILTVRGDYATALELYEQHLPQAIARGLARLGSSMLADVAWCRVHLSQRDRALQQARESELEIDPACDVDDRAATHSRLAQVYEALGDADAAARHAVSAALEWAELARQQQAWLAALERAGLTRPE
jgi:tetratricopeptide (TPR) repeat protein